MKTQSKILGTITLSLALVLSLGVVTVSASPADTLQPASTITYNEEVIVNNTLRTNSIAIGSAAAGVGGATFFNGSIVNNSVDADGNSTIPVTLADDVRIDGEIYRTEKGGDNALKISDDVIPTETATNDFGLAANEWNNIYTVDATVSGTLTTGALSGTGIVSSANILDGEIVAGDIAADAVGSSEIASNAVTPGEIAADAVGSSEIAAGAVGSSEIASDAVTSTQIAAGAVVEADLANDAVTPDKINGTGGANLPVAYGAIDFSGGIYGATSNVTSVNKLGTGIYEIIITGVTFAAYTDYAVLVTNNTTGTYSVYSSNASDRVEVRTYNSSDALADASFSFIVYDI